MKTYYNKSKGIYSMKFSGKSEPEWQVWMQLPEGAPKRGISETWDQDDEPDIDGLLPSEVAELMAKRNESYWIKTSKEENRAVYEWIAANAPAIDEAWLADQIIAKERELEGLRDRRQCILDSIEEAKQEAAQ
jgi:hypothetical protein